MERDVVELMRSWMFDMHMMGRHLSYGSKQAVEAAAAQAIDEGGSLADAFNAARATCPQEV